MDNLTSSQNSTPTCNIPVIKIEKVKDLVYNHFKEVADGPLSKNLGELPCKDESTTKKELLSKNKKQGAVFSGKILSFGCSVCKDNHTFSPNDLLKHFRAHHKETLPTYPCDLCNFVTNEFSSLQRHRIEHRNTLVTCELCNDDVQYSLLLLTRHYIMCHSFNGQFKCDWCEFITMDAGTFVQHIHHHNEQRWKCSQCQHISLNEEDHQKHRNAHLGTFPFTCQVCGWGASKREGLKNHTATVHKSDTASRKVVKSLEESSTQMNAVPNLKMLVTKSGESQEPQRSSKLNKVTGILPNQTNRIQLQSDMSKETYKDGSIANMDTDLNKGSPNSEPSAVLLPEAENILTSEVGNQSNTNGVTVLMVKNKISLPPHCTTKVMGFKMVDGKKHLVLKVIPTTQPDLLNHSSVEGASESGPNLVNPNCDSPVENGQCSTSRSSKSHCLALSPTSVPCLQLDQGDIMAVKVKLEEEETLVYSSPSPTENLEERTNISLNQGASEHPATNELDDIVHHHPIKTANTEDFVSDNPTCNSDLSSLCCSSITTAVTGCETATSTPRLTRTDKNSTVVENGCNSELKENFATEMANLTPPMTSEKSVIGSARHQNGQVTSTPVASANWTENAKGLENCAQILPNTEVFAFHNYSKESFTPSSGTKQSLNNTFELMVGEESDCESMQVNSSLPGTPEHSPHGAGANEQGEQCETTDKSSLREENPESVFQDFNIIKIEDESFPICKTSFESKDTSTFPETMGDQHSDATIKKPLNKSPATSSPNPDSLKQGKATLRILQLPDGKQPVLLKTTEQRFSMPPNVNTSTGFKVITNSGNPQISVSYMKPGVEISRNSFPKSCTIGSLASNSATVEKATTYLSASKPGIGTNSNHYIINKAGLTRPLLLSSKPNPVSADKSAKKQPTCYLVQRSVPAVQASTTSGLKLASAQFPVNARPILAMPPGSTDKANVQPNGRQTFLLRYISPTKSGIVLNKQETQSLSHHIQTNDSAGNKVILKIVTPTGRLLTSTASPSNGQPLFLATRPPTQCFFVSSNKMDASSLGGLKKTSLQNSVKNSVRKPVLSPARVNLKMCDAEKPTLAPRPIRPPSQRKRRRKALFDELPFEGPKARRLSTKLSTERETLPWKPVAKEVVRTLRLAPFSSKQLIKCPHRYQPVVVLNHPDAAIPEVDNIMKVVTRYKGAVTKVSLSRTTIQALSETGVQRRGSFRTKGASSHSNDQSSRRVQSCVQERFLLKMKLRKKSRKKYEVVKTPSDCIHKRTFECWFCGRLFKSQEDWIGHGQRHLMEATRDWN